MNNKGWDDENEESFRDYLQNKTDWADKVFAADDVLYPNGRSSHDIALITGGVACDWLTNKDYLNHDRLLASEAFDAECVAQMQPVSA